MPENARAVSQGRIATLDILRGVAILGILYLNMLYMGNHGVEYEMTGDPRPFGWTSADQAYYLYFRSLMNGTQRGILELLFGASAIILTRQVMSRDGPVEAADIYFRRAFWLMIFGILHGTLLLWYGEIWTTYSIAALPLFLFRRLPARQLLLLGAGGVFLLSAMELPGFLHGLALEQRVEVIESGGGGLALTEAQARDLAEWRDLYAERAKGAAEYEGELEARKGGYSENLAFSSEVWRTFNNPLAHPEFILEAFLTMLIGMAFFKWGILQADRATAFYVTMAVIGYGVGLTLRVVVTSWRIDHGFPAISFSAVDQFFRLLITFGHVSLICLALRSRLGRILDWLFTAAGRMPMTCYLIQTLIACWFLFPGFGLGLVGRFGWMELGIVATAINAVLILFCNLWMRSFAMGPAEWLWRWFSYRRRSPFRRPAVA